MRTWVIPSRRARRAEPAASGSAERMTRPQSRVLWLRAVVAAGTPPVQGRGFRAVRGLTARGARHATAPLRSTRSRAARPHGKEPAHGLEVLKSVDESVFQCALKPGTTPIDQSHHPTLGPVGGAGALGRASEKRSRPRSGPGPCGGVEHKVCRRDGRGVPGRVLLLDAESAEGPTVAARIDGQPEPGEPCLARAEVASKLRAAPT